eukprot:267471_1
MKHVTSLRSNATANVMNHITAASSYHIEDVQYSNQMTRFVYQKQNSPISSPPPRQITQIFITNSGNIIQYLVIWIKIIGNRVHYFGQNDKIISHKFVNVNNKYHNWNLHKIYCIVFRYYTQTNG